MTKIITPVLMISILLFIHSCCPKVIYTDPAGPVYTGTFRTENGQQTDTLKVISYNVEYGLKVDQVIAELQGATTLQRPQVVLLQEMDEIGTEKIARALQMNYVYYPAAVHTYGRHFGEAVLTTGRITDYKKVVLPHNNPLCGQVRIMTTAQIQLGELRFWAASTHTEVNTLSRHKRLAQARAVFRILPDTVAAIIAGDFNSLFSGFSDSLVTIADSAGYDWATREVDYTLVSALGLMRFKLDHIFTKGFCVIAAGSYKKARASDHYPVWALLLPRRD